MPLLSGGMATLMESWIVFTLMTMTIDEREVERMDGLYGCMDVNKKQQPRGRLLVRLLS